MNENEQKAYDILENFKFKLKPNPNNFVIIKKYNYKIFKKYEPEIFNAVYTLVDMKLKNLLQKQHKKKQLLLNTYQNIYNIENLNSKYYS